MGSLLVQRGNPSPYQPSGHALRWLTALGMCVALGMLLLGGFAAYSARQDAWRLAEQQSGNLLLALERDIGRNVTVFDLSLQGVIEALAEPGIDSTSPGIRRHALFDRAAGAEDLGTIVVLAADGDVVESSNSLPRGLNFAGRRDFAVHRERADVGLYLSRASRSWFDDDQPTVWLSRRIPTADGHFAGVVSGALRLSYFQHLFEQIDIGPKGSISLIRSDGRTVWRYPSNDGDFDRDLGASEIFRRMAATGNGRHVGTSVVDGVTRLYTFGQVGALPLILSVNFAVDDIYARWRQKAFIIGPVLCLMGAAVVMLSLLFRREMLRRAAAEAALAEAAHDLSLLAATDALTGLANRRTFEERIEEEWRRALRNGDVLSLLMIDADHFKSFNDRYGHQEGDRVLRLVAAGIAEGLPHAADLAARFGGEEFVALLPGCDGARARTIAERIRAGIEHLAISHAGSLAGRVTVSIGVATAMPVADGTVDDLLRCADAQLYVAKRNGRNTVSEAVSPESPDDVIDYPVLLRRGS